MVLCTAVGADTNFGDMDFSKQSQDIERNRRNNFTNQSPPTVTEDLGAPVEEKIRLIRKPNKSMVAKGSFDGRHSCCGWRPCVPKTSECHEAHEETATNSSFATLQCNFRGWKWLSGGRPFSPMEKKDGF
ncbi:hypothetical protein NE237_017810 [Protea cynaroides]|uniref:Uncharacterized protein n=1 Tax=Protea cynaroides TaxID=273540 RepID=A0A9Q0K8T7_9MAGN|nr:hypothetical protein NE237_017810 [Protea cynaroides]